MEMSYITVAEKGLDNMRYRLKVERIRRDILFFEDDADSKEHIVKKYWKCDGPFWDDDAVDGIDDEGTYTILEVTEVKEDE